MQISTLAIESPASAIAVVASECSRVRYQLRRTGLPFEIFKDYKSLHHRCVTSQPPLIIVTQDSDIVRFADEVLRSARSYELLGIPILVIGNIETENYILNLVAAGVGDVVSSAAVDVELVSRIKSLVHRTQANRDKREFPPYLFDVENERIYKNGVIINTTTMEFKLALFLFSNPYIVHSRGVLLQQVWGISALIDTRRVDTHISRLRSNLGLNGKDGLWYLKSVYIQGYVLTDRRLT